MSANINGTIDWGIQLQNEDASSNLAALSWSGRRNFLVSANSPLRFQIIWTSTGVTEDTEPSKANWTGGSSLTSGNGDVVNIVFKVYATTTSPASSTLSDYEYLGAIKKSRDIPNRRYNTQTPPLDHRFTVDLAPLVRDKLSYSLVPINKGTWQSHEWGGMNGGLAMQDNVTEPVSFYNVTPNGCIRTIKVLACPEVINGEGTVIEADGYNGGKGYKTLSKLTRIINSVAQYGEDSLINRGTDAKFVWERFNNYRFLSRCKNEIQSNTVSDAPYMKPARLDEQAEWLYWYMYTGQYTSGGTRVAIQGMGMKVETFDSISGSPSVQDTFYIKDFEDTARFDGANIHDDQERMFVQNVSPSFINNADAFQVTSSSGAWATYTGDRITSDVAMYRVSVNKVYSGADTVVRVSRYRYYIIDKEDEKLPYGFVRFHWLNTMGGIDSYTAKRNITEGYSISKDIIERKSVDRMWKQDDAQATSGAAIPNSTYVNDTMRGGNQYKGGREVLNINAEKRNSVYTEPLSNQVSKWLKEITMSPNVWIEVDSDATAENNTANPYLRPSTKGYMPVIITNSDIETVNEEQGLVRFNLEYIFSHKVQTQRN